MKLKVKFLEFLAGKPIAIINRSTANRVNVHIGERILISKFGDSLISVIDLSNEEVKTDEISVSEEIVAALSLKEGDYVEVSLAEKPESTLFIRKKIDKQTLEKNEINKIVFDIVNNALTEAEIAYFVSAVYQNGMTDTEVENMISAMVSTGKRLNFKGEVVDKHSIGGIAANRTTPIVISICAAAGLTIPKTSSRAITSAAGTADVIESIAEVEFSIDEIRKIVEKTNACMVWGGSLGLSPADDKLIQVERILNLDPWPQLLASVLSKKISVGSKHIVIDIPYGKSAKVDKKKAAFLKMKFEKLARKFNLNLKCVLTDGSQPIGNGIGPLLEIRDVLRVLKREEPPKKQDSPRDLENKAIMLAGELFELCKKSKKGKGESLARELVTSGKAFAKFKQIIEAQRGHVPSMKELESRLGKHIKHVLAEKNLVVKEINNKKLSILANIAGSPMDKGSGVYLHKHVGEKISKGEKILTIYSDSDERLKNALEFYSRNLPIVY